MKAYELQKSDEVGPAVTRLKVGDRVTANFFPTWRDGLPSAERHSQSLGSTVDGMLAEEVALDEHVWVAVPAHQYRARVLSVCSLCHLTIEVRQGT